MGNGGIMGGGSEGRGTWQGRGVTKEERETARHEQGGHRQQKEGEGDAKGRTRWKKTQGEGSRAGDGLGKRRLREVGEE